MPLTSPVQIETGLIAGVPSPRDPNVTVFRGIPFAASTAGPNRWRPPQPAAPWPGVRHCADFGPIAPQLPPGPLYWTAEPVAQSEDCLSLNIWTPADSGEVGTAKHPVYVWIYGGKFLWGAGSDNNFEGSGLAAKGVVVVTFNYRLGILGWLAHPELAAESGHDASGNYGLLDQIACLEWIQRNITAVGGDPGRVTIGGQSAGSACVGLHVYGPLSKGLFHGAIHQSGFRHPRDPLISCLAPSYRTKQQAESEGEMILAEKSAESMAQMREKSLEELLEGNHRDDLTNWGPPPFYRACLDGWVFPRTFEESLDQGTMNDVPILNGQNKDESGNYTHPDFNDTDLAQVAPLKYGRFSSRFMDLYADEGPALARWNAACQDNSRVGPHLLFAKWQQHAKSDMYIYHWVHAPPPRRGFLPKTDVQKAQGYTYFNGPKTGAYHAAEIPYVFDALWTDVDYPFGAADERIAEVASEYWANFIRTGNPNGAGLAAWASAGEDAGRVMELGMEQGMVPNTKSEGRERFWGEYFAEQRAW